MSKETELDALRYRWLRTALVGIFGERIGDANVWRAGEALDEYVDQQRLLPERNGVGTVKEEKR